jgi:lipopolysaccharide/colanic/teichoic acid biosynthesis glycosyltransferase
MKTKRLHARVLQQHRDANQDDFLLNDEDFRFAAECERMRVDRNGSILSLLLIRLSDQHAGVKDIAFLARVLEGRLRVTDTPGRLHDGHVAVLLPDTPEEGAWKVAADISEVFPPGPDRPECEVLVYPRQGHHRKSSHADEQDQVKGSPAQTGSEAPGEFFFARAMPWWKRAIDILGGIVGLLVSAPVIAVSATAVKIGSPGPALFCQEREGLGGRRFKIWKLRTMVPDAELRKHELRSHSHQDGPAFKMKADPRITSVGRFLRWSSIDELPQFWNVLRGEMSLVGPRPLPTEESTACKNWQRRRLEVHPGITCIWQISGRGNVRFDDWVRMDLRYLQRYSFLEDLRIMLLTLPSLLLQKGIR